MNDAPQAREPQNAVDDTRVARAAVSEATHGFAHLREHLQQIQREYATRTGRFAGLPAEPPHPSAAPSKPPKPTTRR